MPKTKTKRQFREWLHRYIIAELLGTLIAVCFAYVSFTYSHSYIIAAGSGFVGEGIGFYGYFVTTELWVNGKAYKSLPIIKRLTRSISRSATNLIIEFAPAEVIDNIFIRPFLMFYVPQHIKPFVIGFIAGKFLADVLFYAFAISGYEIKKKIRRL